MQQAGLADDHGSGQGLERHITPAASDGVVTRASSDRMFGFDGLGFGRTPITTAISWLARNGITEQTNSNPDETNLAHCVLGWGQGAFSSRVFEAEGGIDEGQLHRLIEYLLAIADELGTPGRIDDAVLAAFVGTLPARPFLAFDGMREHRGFRERAAGRFRAHIQWQALYHLCGQIGCDGEKRVSPKRIEQLFGSAEPFFAQLIERRCLLKQGALAPGAREGPLGGATAEVDGVRSDRELRRTKSGARMLGKILFYMLTRKRTQLGALPSDSPAVEYLPAE